MCARREGVGVDSAACPPPFWFPLLVRTKTIVTRWSPSNRSSRSRSRPWFGDPSCYVVVDLSPVAFFRVHDIIAKSVRLIVVPAYRPAAEVTHRDRVIVVPVVTECGGASLTHRQRQVGRQRRLTVWATSRSPSPLRRGCDRRGETGISPHPPSPRPARFRARPQTGSAPAEEMGLA